MTDASLDLEASRRRAGLRGAGGGALMFASGFAGLGLEMVWTQESALLAGHETPAVLAVMAAFFGGMAIGAWTLGSRLARGSPAQALRGYVVCELLVASWTLLRSLGGAALWGRLAPWLGPAPSPWAHGALVFAATFLSLLPATAAMGATLPAMDRVMTTLRGPRSEGGAGLAGLYAANTAGAVLGVLLTIFWLLPTFGLRLTSWTCAALAALCAGGSWRFLRPSSGAVAGAPRAAAGSRADGPRTAQDARGTLLARLAWSGFLGIGYEVLVVRVLGQVNESTVYTFALLLAIYLVGTASGAAAFARFGVSRARGVPPEPASWVAGLPLLLALTCLGGTFSLMAAPRLREETLAFVGPGNVMAALASEALPAWLAFFLPAMAMGALFAELARNARAQGLPLGRALAVNTLGAALAPLGFGVLLGPQLGPKGALLIVAAGYLGLAPLGLWRRRRARGLGLAVAAAGLLVIVAMPPLVIVDVPAGGTLLSHEEGVAAAVSVVEDARGVMTLRINNRAQEGSNVTLRVDARQAWQPLLLHPSPRRALFLGLGTGVTARAAAADPGLVVDVVELLPEVVRAAARFPQEPLGEPAAGATRGTEPRVRIADARRFVRATSERWDVIVADNFHPARSGAGALYTVEHFRAVRARLAAGGLFCQWLPLHQMELDSLGSIVRSFLEAFPSGAALLASNSLETPVLGLVGGADERGGLAFEPAVLARRLAGAPGSVRALGFEDELAVLGSFVAGPRALARWTEHAPLNTDDRPVVMYLGPRATYAPTSAPRERLMAFMQRAGVDADELLSADSRATWAARLGAYGRARDRFLEAGRAVRPSTDVVAMLAQVESPLLESLQLSGDFRPAYDPLLAMARALAGRDLPHAQSLLEALTRLQPARGEASDLLASLSGAAQ